MRLRRAEERARPHLVDRVSWPVFVLSALLLVLTLADGLITVELLDHGCEEANPFLRFLLERSTGAFFVAKYLLTAVFLPIALVMNQYPLFGTRFRVGHFIPIVAALYLTLIAYQIALWNAAEGEPGIPAVIGNGWGVSRFSNDSWKGQRRDGEEEEENEKGKGQRAKGKGQRVEDRSRSARIPTGFIRCPLALLPFGLCPFRFHFVLQREQAERMPR